MNKILAYGVRLPRNFGGPSIVSGFVETLKAVDSDCKIVIYCLDSLENVEVVGSAASIKAQPVSSKWLLLSYFLQKWFGITLGNREEVRVFWEDFKNANVVVNLYGICFCDKFGGADPCVLARVKGAMSALLQFPINFIAKMENKRSVKCTASYGPVTRKCTQSAVRFATRFCFDGMIAREKESLEVIKKMSRVNYAVMLSPDIANAMKCSAKRQGTQYGKVGISVSFQIIKQWGGKKDMYYSCIRSLVEKILQLGCRSVILLPNEIKGKGIFDDSVVAHEIKTMFADDDQVVVHDVELKNAAETKDEIASCDVFVASRYHSCVAALSSGVPLLVIGWHYKYENLMELYGQKEWLLSTCDCTPEILVEKFCGLWHKKESIRRELKNRAQCVLNKVYESGKFILGIENG